ncbi:uncharacterized protein LOC124910393 [Impatiens glandulifera]|uniref:uncharacterized protein LOC124910393 n=1 Tax=Impatiens glandulifera TaxID=253017 RepID=UPI001FB09C2D|nr:uncharacterized protein LOC124910393 [Impatiens glandulifera]
MLKIDSKLKQSTRKPLREVYNGVKSSKSVKIKKLPDVSEQRATQKDASLDRLLLVHSDLSSLLRQTDELVVQALKLDLNSRNGLNELESFTQLLSSIQTSLKPWVPRIQKALSDCSNQSDCEEDSRNEIESPEQMITESRVSLSPLVSWRGDFANEGGTQLFLLTPMPKLKSISSKLYVTGQRPSSSSIIAISTNTNDDLLESVIATPNKTSLVVMTTPYKKMSPKKSCVVLEPISEITPPKNNAANRTSTPFPVGNLSDSSESSSGDDYEDEASKNLSLKYSEMMGGIVQSEKVEDERKDLDSSPYWFFSPPKTCLVMEPQEDDYSKSVELDFAAAKSINTSIVMEKQHHGENTLKKELWMKFEDASDEVHPIRYIPPQKGFLDRLDEAL